MGQFSDVDTRQQITFRLVHRHMPIQTQSQNANIYWAICGEPTSHKLTLALWRAGVAPKQPPPPWFDLHWLEELFFQIPLAGSRSAGRQAAPFIDPHRAEARKKLRVA